MFLSEWSEFLSAPCLARKETWYRTSRCCWNRACRLTYFGSCFLPDRAKDLSAPGTNHETACWSKIKVLVLKCHSLNAYEIFENTALEISRLTSHLPTSDQLRKGVFPSVRREELSNIVCKVFALCRRILFRRRKAGTSTNCQLNFCITIGKTNMSWIF